MPHYLSTLDNLLPLPATADLLKLDQQLPELSAIELARRKLALKILLTLGFSTIVILGLFASFYIVDEASANARPKIVNMEFKADPATIGTQYGITFTKMQNGEP